MAYLTENELRWLGLGSCGDNVRISERASIYNPQAISIGSNVRIDDYCILSAGSGGLHLGSHIHMAPYSSMVGQGRIVLGDYCNVSWRVSMFSSNDDYSGQFMTSPVIPAEFTNVEHADVVLEEHCLIGAGSVVLPGSYLERGVAVGALSLVKGRLREFSINAGVPSVFIKERSRQCLVLAEQHRKRLRESGQ